MYQSLGYIEAIQKRPGMYIGTTDDPTHLATEIIDNAMDEISNNYANFMDVSINSDGSCWVVDNGRGFKVYDMTLASGDVCDSVEALCTVTHTGSKFDNGDYASLIGMHGVGMVAVNALSDWFIIKTRDKKNKRVIHEYTFLNASLYDKKIIDNTESWSTVIGFKPSSEYFTSIEFDKKHLLERLLLAQAQLGDLNTLRFNSSDIPKLSFAGYTRKKLGLDDDECLYNIKKTVGNIKFNIHIAITRSLDTRIYGDVNIRECGGSYLSSFQTLLTNCLIKKMPNNLESLSNLFLLGVRCYVSLTLPEPKFSSQTKERMDLNVRTEVNTLEPEINKLLTKSMINVIIDNINLKEHKKLLTATSTSKKTISNTNKIKDAITIPGDVLYILEGDSAMGTLNKIRDKYKEGAFPLKGKVLNIENASINKIKNNTELQNLIEGIGHKEHLRYNKIKILCDADPDGYHIAVLLVFFFARFYPELIKDRRISIIIPPLYGAIKNKDFKALYKLDDTIKYRDQGYTIKRFKGLGEMEPFELDMTIRNEIEYVLSYPDSKSMESLLAVLTNSAIKQQLLLKPEFDFDKILEIVTTDAQ